MYIQDHRHSCLLTEGIDQVVIARDLFCGDRLQPTGAVDMGDNRDLGALPVADLVDLQHEENVVIGFDPLSHMPARAYWSRQKSHPRT